ncbi:CoA-binding protein [Corynebacterium breve]|uniref:CoA-binding protein n=1 Tax=Corynebacterium breve TaxID=3049799 RepID=A0ABY8VGN8_9CORY|nr:CoA-binding protein [Corynebacterium breve]WIM67808.1 CoA-binding protein [Corynebacterium breve]
MSSHSLDSLFKPRGIAVIGASENPDKLGSIMIRSLSNFPGPVVGINPKGGEGLHTSVAEAVEAVGPIDLVISCVPAPATANALREASKAGATSSLICSGGFAEAGGEFDKYEAELQAAIDETGIRVLGPNTSGFFLPGEDLLACFVPSVKLLKPGKISVISSSGGVNLASCYSLARLGQGVRLGVGIGGAINVTATEVLEYLTEDEATEVVALHIEKVEDGPRLRAAVEAATRKKPVVALVIGRTDIKEFARRHTGSLDTSWELTRSVLRNAGAVVVDTEQEMVESAVALTGKRIPPKKNPQASFVTGQAGPGMIIADRLQTDGVDLPYLDSSIVDAIGEILPPMTHFKNPVDTGRPAPGLRKIIEITARDEQLDVLGAFAIVEETLNLTTEFVESGVTHLPVLASVDGPSETISKAMEIANQQGIPLLVGPTSLAVGIRALVEDSRARYAAELERIEGVAATDSANLATSSGASAGTTTPADGVTLIAEARHDDIFRTTVSLRLGANRTPAEHATPVFKGLAQRLITAVADADEINRFGALSEANWQPVDQVLASLAKTLEENPQTEQVSATLQVSKNGVIVLDSSLS